MPSEMTPEEKLLALIQQDRRASDAGAKASPPVAAGKPSEPSRAAPGPVASTPEARPPSGAGAERPAASQAIVAPAPIVPARGPSPGGVAASSPAPAAVPDATRIERPAEGKLVSAKEPVHPSPEPAKAVSVSAGDAVRTVVVPPGPRRDVSDASEEPDQSRKLRLAPTPAATASASRAAVTLVEPPAEPSEAPTIAAESVVPQGEPPKAAGTGRVFHPRTPQAGVTAFGILNRALGLVVLVLLIIVVYSAASVRSDVGDRMRLLREGAGDLQLPAATVETEPVPPVEQFLVKAKSRSLFVSPVVVTNEPKPDLAAAVKDLKLMGISLDTTTPSESMVIIRNKALSQTYFLKPGQMVGETGLTLDRVLTDRAILKQKKQEIELR